jgi:hypothetical protein
LSLFLVLTGAPTQSSAKPHLERGPSIRVAKRGKKKARGRSGRKGGAKRKANKPIGATEEKAQVGEGSEDKTETPWSRGVSQDQRGESPPASPRR